MKCYIKLTILQSHWFLPFWGISPRNLTLFTRLFLARRRVRVEYKTNFSPRPSQALDSLQYGFCSLVPRLLRSVFLMMSCLRRKDTRLSMRVQFNLVPSPSSHVRERGSGVLNDFSCHMGRGRMNDIWKNFSTGYTTWVTCRGTSVVGGEGLNTLFPCTSIDRERPSHLTDCVRWRVW